MAIDPISIAIQVALVVASIILTAKNVEVGKLDDINVDTGSYNRLVPRVYGTQVIVPQTIWIAGNKLIEVKKKKNIIFGLGGSITTYSYFATFALAVTNNQVQLRRVWAGDKLIYDFSDTANGGLSDDLREQISDSKLPFDWEYFDGRNDQSISGIIKSVDGAAATPAYRGISYLVVKNLPLKDYGNTIPQFKFEVVEVNGVDHRSLTIPNIIGTSVPSALDEYDRLVQISTSNYIGITDPLTGEIDFVQAEVGSDIFFGPGTGYYAPKNAILRGQNGGASLLDAVSGKVLGFATGGGAHLTASVMQGDYWWMVDLGDNVQVAHIPSMCGLSGVELDVFPIPGGDVNFTEIAPTASLVSPRFGATFTDVLGFGTTLYIHGMDFIDLSALGYGTRPGIGFSQLENAFVIIGSGGIHKINLLGQVMGHLPRAMGNNVVAARNLSQQDHASIWLIATDGNFIKVNVATLQIEREVNHTDISGVGSGATEILPLYKSNAILVLQGSWKTVFLDRVDQAETTVQHIVEDLADQIGFPQARLDASAGTRTIGGMIVAGDDARRSIDELLKITGYDLIEEDGKVKIIDRGNAPVMAIDLDDLGTNENDGEAYRLERTLTREADAPWKVELGFADIDGDFESNLAIARRAIDAVETQTVLSVDTPIALDVDTAKTFAGKMLSQAHRERAGVSLSLPMVKYGRLSPGDVITVPDGTDALNVKIVRASGSSVLSIKGVIDDPTGIDTLLIGAARGVPSATLSQIGVPSVIMIDSALPHDGASAQNGYGLSSFSLLAGREIGPVDLVRSIDDGASFALLDVTEGEPMVGKTSVTLMNIETPTLMDHVSSFTVSLAVSPVAATQQELLDDASRNILFVAAGNDWEIVQFANAVDNGDGTYVLSGFYRGLRGTERLISDHSAGDLAVFVSDGYVRSGDLSHYQVAAKYAALQSEDDNPPIVDFTPALRALKPYSPIDLKIEKDLGDNLISWTRRTRVGGAQLNGSDVPLSETSESYEIDIVDNSDTVLATKTGIATNSFIYTAADQITDLGAADTPYTARVYQISAEVGRGTSTELVFANPPDDPIIFQLSFPTASTVEDSSQNNHTVNLMGGATISTTQTWAGQAASVDCTDFDKLIELPDSEQFIRGAKPWTYEAMLYITEDTTENLDLFAHWLNPSDRSFAIQRLSSRKWESYHSANSSSFNTITTSSTHPFSLNQWTHFAIARHPSGNVSFWIDGTLIINGDPGISSYHDSFNGNPRPFKIVGNNSTDDGVECFVGWVALRKDDVYGEISSFSPPLIPYI